MSTSPAPQVVPMSQPSTLRYLRYPPIGKPFIHRRPGPEFGRKESTWRVCWFSL